MRKRGSRGTAAAAEGWRVRIKGAASNEAAQLPWGARSEFSKLLVDLAEDPYSIAGARGMRSYRSGFIVNLYTSYRVCFEVYERSRTVKVFAVGHRSTVYKGIPRSP